MALSLSEIFGGKIRDDFVTGDMLSLVAVTSTGGKERSSLGAGAVSILCE